MNSKMTFRAEWLTAIRRLPAELHAPAIAAFVELGLTGEMPAQGALSDAQYNLICGYIEIAQPLLRRSAPRPKPSAPVADTVEMFLPDRPDASIEFDADAPEADTSAPSEPTTPITQPTTPTTAAEPTLFSGMEGDPALAPVAPKKKAHTPRAPVIFSPPTLDEVRSWIVRQGYDDVDPQCFFDYYNFRGWTQANGHQIKSWKSAVATWRQNGLRYRNTNNTYSHESKSAYQIPRRDRTLHFEPKEFTGTF